MHIWYCSVAGRLPNNPHCTVSTRSLLSTPLFSSLSNSLSLHMLLSFSFFLVYCRLRKKPKQEKNGKLLYVSQSSSSWQLHVTSKFTSII